MIKIANQKYYVVLFLAVSLLIMLFQFQFFYGGYFGYDDIEYIKLEKDVIFGTYKLDENLYSYRWTVVFPLSGLYKVFGINDFSNFIFNVIPRLLIVYFTIKLINNYSLSTKLITVLFISFLPTHLSYLEKPMPDVWIELGFLLCFSAYYGLKYLQYKINYSIIQFSIGAIIIFLAKETFLILYPFFLILFVLDLKSMKNISFWKGIVIALVTFLTIYFLGFYILTGNALARINAIFQNRYIGSCSYDLLPMNILIDRIVYMLWFDLIRKGFLIPIGFFVLLSKKNLKPQYRFILWSTISMLLLSNFMTILYTSYSPLSYDARHYMFLIPLLALTFSIGIENFKLLNIKDILVISIALLFQLIISYLMHYENVWYYYIPLILCFIYYFFYQNRVVFFIILSAALMVPFIQLLNYNRTINYAEQRQIFEIIKNENRGPYRIVTDPCNTELGKFYNKYQLNGAQIIEFKDFTTEMRKDQNIKTYIVLNGYTAFLANIGWEDYPDYVHNFENTMINHSKNKGEEIFIWKPE